MICTTIQNRNLKEILSVLQNPQVEMAEIRLDRCDLSLDDIDDLFSGSDIPLVATCRIDEVKKRLVAEGAPEDEKLESKACQMAEAALGRAIQAGATFADLEIEAPAMMSKRIRREAGEYGTIFIRSYHDWNGTDSLAALEALVEKCRNLGAEVVKLVTTAKDDSDVDRVLSLYSTHKADNLIAFCMGEVGKRSRIDCIRKGAPYTYAALDESEAAAPGQMSLTQMAKEIYHDRKMVGARQKQPIVIPASKSFAQRAIVAAAMADGESVLHGYTPCGDNESAISAITNLGAKVRRDGTDLYIKGIGAYRGCFKSGTLHTGESGFLTRMLIPLLSHIATDGIEVTGEKTLVKRPLTGAAEIMGAFGVTLENISADGENAVKVPLRIKGKISGGNVEISGKNGSQLISGLLSVLPLLEEDSEIHVTDPKSIPYIFITVDVLKKFGIVMESEMEGDEEFVQTQNWDCCSGMTFRIKGGQQYKAAEVDIEGDWSSGANFMVAGAVFGKIDIKGLDTHSLQADLSILDILMEAGACMSQIEDEGLIHIQRAPLMAFEVDASNCPDLFPIVAVLAAFCRGTSRISGVGRLANKESDRAKSILAMLTQMGVNARIKGDVLVIEGHTLPQRLMTSHLLKGGKYTSNHDHRMVMALKVAEFGADGPIEIDDTECVSKSFPLFFEMYDRL